MERSGKVTFRNEWLGSGVVVRVWYGKGIVQSCRVSHVS